MSFAPPPRPYPPDRYTGEAGEVSARLRRDDAPHDLVNRTGSADYLASLVGLADLISRKLLHLARIIWSARLGDGPRLSSTHLDAIILTIENQCSSTGCALRLIHNARRISRQSRQHIFSVLRRVNQLLAHALPPGPRHLHLPCGHNALQRPLRLGWPTQAAFA